MILEIVTTIESVQNYGILGNSKTSKKYQNFMELLPSAYSSSQYENFGSTSKSFI